jgi:hypothetical protein
MMFSGKTISDRPDARTVRQRRSPRPYAQAGSESVIKPRPALFPVLCLGNIVFPGFLTNSTVIPVTRIPRTYATPDIASMIDTVRPVSMVT